MGLTSTGTTTEWGVNLTGAAGRCSKGGQLAINSPGYEKRVGKACRGRDIQLTLSWKVNRESQYLQADALRPNNVHNPPGTGHDAG
jgi:hypothetical protein